MNEETILTGIRKALDESPERNFTQTVEININFEGVNVQGEHKINSSVVLPKGRGREFEVGFFADGDMMERAKKISSHVLGSPEIEEYAKDRGKMKSFANACGAFVAQPDLMPLIGKSWGVVLGPRNKMPQPVPPNADLEPVLQRLINTVKLRTRKSPLLHAPVGTEDMTPEDLYENIKIVLNEIEKVIPLEHVKSMYVKTTMGPAVKAW